MTHTYHGNNNRTAPPRIQAMTDYLLALRAVESYINELKQKQETAEKRERLLALRDFLRHGGTPPSEMKEQLELASIRQETQKEVLNPPLRY